MVQATAAQQQCYYVDINGSGEQGNGKSIICDYEGNIICLLYTSDAADE